MGTRKQKQPDPVTPDPEVMEAYERGGLLGLDRLILSRVYIPDVEDPPRVIMPKI